MSMVSPNTSKPNVLQCSASELKSQHCVLMGARFLSDSPSLLSASFHTPLLQLSFDLTERKRAEYELSESEERYRELVENARDIIYQHDLKGNYTSINKAGQQLTGYSLAETLELNLKDTVAPEYLDKAREMLRLKLAGETVTAYELEILTKNGSRTPVEANTRLVYQNGVPVGVQGIARDITERKRLEQALRESEEQLRQSQKLEAIGQLAGGVAHDFNNLLTAINGYSALALRRVGEDHPITPYLEEIKKAGDRAANLTRQLLAFGRKQLLQPLALNLNDIVGDMIKLLKRLIGEDIQLITKPGANLKQIKADPGQLEQVLVNLVVNARDAMPRGGIVTIETANTTLDGDICDQTSGRDSGRIRDAGNQRHRNGNGSEDPIANLRTVLYYQGKGQGHRPRALNRVRNYQAERWQHLGLQRTRERHHVQSLSAVG